VVAFKLVAAAVSGSISVLAEGLQSTLDILMTGLTLWVLRISSAPPDEKHPYGYGKAELLSSAFQMILVVVTAMAIAWQAGMRLLHPQSINVDLGLAAMGYAVLSNTLVMKFVQREAKATNSAALRGEVEHLRSDTLASVGVLGGLVAYYFTRWQPLDPIVAVVCTLAGATYAIKQLLRVIPPLMDSALPPEELEKIKEVLRHHSQARGFHNVRTRMSGNLRIVVLHVMLDDKLTFVEAHNVAEQLESELSKAIDGALVTVHYEPYEAESAHRATEHGELMEPDQGGDPVSNR